MAADPDAAPGRKGRGKGGLEIAFDPLADGALDMADALGSVPDPFAPEPEGADAAAAGQVGEEDDEIGKPARAASRQRQAPTDPSGAPPAEPDAAGAPGQGAAPPPPDDEPLLLIHRKARQRAADAAAERLGLSPTLARIDVTVTVEIGRTRMTLSELASVTPGELVALDRMTEEPVDVLVNGRLFARGEVVALGAAFGVRLLDLAGEAP
jgi:flagellar motor switch protein FliN/FliY